MKDNTIGSIRESYDRLVAEYARRIYDELQHKPFDRELLSRFASQVAKQGDVCDIGCGPGHVTRYLREAGVAAFGVDLSPGMLKEARRLNPDIFFREADMTDLDLPDETLVGIAAFYSIVNLSEETLLLAFREMERVLKPGGQLLLAFHVGHGVTGEDELWGNPISMDFFFYQPSEIRRHIEAAGLAIEEIVEREPYPAVEYPSRRAYIFARKKGTA
jgi:SAM-dependent methyltransferase